MGFRINTNIAALQAHTSSVMNNKNLDNSLARLSSGLRINKAADDASGMSIADSLHAQSTGLSQAVNNANDGVAVVQTADGALNEYINIINTVRTKAIQAASDGQNTDSRNAIQADIDKLLQAANSIATTTQFNGQQLLDGTFANKSFHIGAYAGETVSLSVSNTQTDSVGDIKGMSGASTRTVLNTTNDLSEGSAGFALKTGELKVNDTDVSTSLNSLSPLKLTDAASVATAITDATGLIASGTNTFTSANAVGGGDINSTSYLKINGIAIADTTVLLNDSNGALVNAINDISDQTGVTATTDTAHKLVLTSVDGSNIAVDNKSGTAQVDSLSLTAGSNLTNDTLSWTDGTLTAIATLTGSETLTQAAAALASVINGLADYTASSTDGVIAITSAATPTGTPFTGTFSSTDTGSNGTAMAGSESTTTAGVYDTATSTGTTANVTTNTSSANVGTLTSGATASVTLAKGDLVINGVDLQGTYGDGSSPDSARAALEAKIQGIDGMSTSSIATATGKITLNVDNGNDLNIAGVEANSTYKLTKGATNSSQIGSVNIYSDNPVKISGTSPDAFGFTAGTKSVANQGVSLDSIDVTSRDSAEKAILISDSALTSLDSIRSDLGSVQNQLESTIRNISVTQVNVTSAESTIRDVDFASESANFSKYNILAQSGSYAMSQANSVQQNVLRLLQ